MMCVVKLLEKQLLLLLGMAAHTNSSEHASGIQKRGSGVVIPISSNGRQNHIVKLNLPFTGIGHHCTVHMQGQSAWKSSTCKGNVS
ncbi:hypothetical protein M758_4G115000 [Ceratodon purpureus]|uniref:Secreted protein n=1 Tax=Ceratodon purpureus TaxID=3225 RepID=A0A8T0I9Q9_CERPU|nr:hypothetical protein KC19_4G115100 [Ceratodon purpureus]KAG0619083.1 hypothetical protein M758_4G115000 [Ceratodon purpureus]